MTVIVFIVAVVDRPIEEKVYETINNVRYSICNEVVVVWTAWHFVVLLFKFLRDYREA